MLVLQVDPYLHNSLQLTYRKTRSTMGVRNSVSVWSYFSCCNGFQIHGKQHFKQVSYTVELLKMGNGWINSNLIKKLQFVIIRDQTVKMKLGLDLIIPSGAVPLSTDYA